VVIQSAWVGSPPPALFIRFGVQSVGGNARSDHADQVSEDGGSFAAGVPHGLNLGNTADISNSVEARFAAGCIVRCSHAGRRLSRRRGRRRAHSPRERMSCQQLIGARAGTIEWTVAERIPEAAAAPAERLPHTHMVTRFAPPP
jgi:hypothetical protein